MSNQYYAYDKGSSRSARDDSRPRGYDARNRGDEDRSRAHDGRNRGHDDRYQDNSDRNRPFEERRVTEPRSRSPKHDYQDGSSKHRSRSPRPGRDHGSEHKDRSRSPRSKRDRDNDDRGRRARSPAEVPPPPPPPRITKISIDLAKPKAPPIKINMGGPSKPSVSAPKKRSVASVFNDDESDDEPEEMPAEAKMRMRNIGRDTPTSAGPNSFGKTKQGFCDSKKVFEKNLKEAMEAQDRKTGSTKFPQTIYKINP